MPRVTEVEYETVENEVERYKCDKCGYVGDEDEFGVSFRYDDVNRADDTHYRGDEYYYCETCDGSAQVAKKDAELASLAERINKVSEKTAVTTIVVTYCIGAIIATAVSSWTVFTTMENATMAGIVGYMVTLIIFWGAAIVALGFVISIVVKIVKRLGLVEHKS